MTIPDRVAFTLFGKDIYWYGVLMAIGIILAVFFAIREEKRKKLPKDIIIDLCLVIIPCGVVGARLYYVLFHLDRYLQDPISILYIWEGGLAIYGAVIFGLLGALVFARVRKVRFLRLADCIMPGLALAQAIGRWGNFFNQEAFGLPVTAKMIAQFPALQYFPLAVGIEGTHYFNDAVCTACATGVNGVHLHLATFFYESAWCFIIFLVLWLCRKKFKHDGDMMLWYAGLYAFERMFVEGLRGDSLWLIAPNTVSWLSGGIRVSQLLSVVLVIAVLVFTLVRWNREKKLGYLIWPKPQLEPEAAVETEGSEPGDGGEEAETAQQGTEEQEPAEPAETPEQDETAEDCSKEQQENKEGTEE